MPASRRARRAILAAAASVPAGLAATGDAAAETRREARPPLAGKVALVTGAARGIGRATAIELARRGADIALLDIADPEAMPTLGYRLASRAELEEAAVLVRAEGVRAMPLAADLRNLAETRQAAQRIAVEWGAIDLLVCNAGVVAVGRLAETTPAAWQAVMEVNLTGTMHTVWAALPLLRRPGARVVIVTSVAARAGSGWTGAYAASKWGLTGLMKSLALELGPEGITVNAVAPTAVDTPMLRRGRAGRMEQPANPQEAASRQRHALPVGVLPAREIAASIAFLVGPDAACVSGTTLDVNAGRSAELTA